LRPKQHKYAKTTGWLRAELAHYGINSFEIKKLAIGTSRKMKSDAAMQKELEAIGYSFGHEDEAFRFAR
jgi:hypothetical protein